MRRIDVNTMVDVALLLHWQQCWRFGHLFHASGWIGYPKHDSPNRAGGREPCDWVFGRFVVFALQVPERTVFVHPAQVILDYPLANAVLGFAGLWVKYGRAPGDYLRNGLSVCFAMALRFLSHVIAGRIFFSEFALEQGMNEWWYSITYNASWFGPKMVVTLILVMFLLTRREIVEVEQARA